MSELDPKSYWAVRAADYRETVASDYHRNRLRMVEALMRPGDLTGRVVDFGCGDGFICEKVVGAGGSAIGIDIDPSMIAASRDRLVRFGGKSSFVEGGVEALGDLPAGTADVLFALNVLAYLDPESESEFYRHVARILVPDGVLICTHSNELFDMYTLNRYTVEFYRRHFSEFGDMTEVGTLLTHPVQPQRTTFPTRANPLSYGHRLAAFGLREVQQEFAIPHAQPPLLTDGFDPDDLANRRMPQTIDLAPEHRWKLMFVCSIFGVRAVRQA